MTKEVQFRRGTTTQHSTFTGALAEVTVDTDKKIVVVHDGATAGGQEMVGRTATQTITNKTLTSPTISGGTINNASIGATTRSSGAFTDLDANGNVILGSDNTDTITVNGLINSAVEFTGATSHLTLTGELRGPATFVIDPAAVGANSGVVQIKGDLQVDGTTTTINSTILSIDDKTIVLSDGSTTSAQADTSGITLGSTGISFTYTDTGSRWNSTEHISIATGKEYQINGTAVLTASQVLGKTIGGTSAGDIVNIDSSQTLSNKTLTAPRFANNGFIADANGNELIKFVTTANAVNDIRITNAATGTTGPLIESVGETDVDLRFSAAGAGDIVFLDQLRPFAGSATEAPILMQTGTLMTTAAGGAIEYDGSTIYEVGNTTDGRTVGGSTYFRLTANAAAFGPAAATYFGANSSIPLAANTAYLIEYWCWFTKTTAGTLTWSLVDSTAPTRLNVQAESCPITGVTSTFGTGQLSSNITSTTATTSFVATGSLTTGVNHYYKFRVLVVQATAGNLRLNVTQSAGTMTPLAGSYWQCTRLPQTGNYVA